MCGVAGAQSTRSVVTDVNGVVQWPTQMSVTNINLPYGTNSILGAITIGTNEAYIHSFNAAGTLGENFFAGYRAGNFNMSSNGLAQTYAASGNTGVGFGSLFVNSNGWNNTAIGTISMVVNTSGNNNSAIGNSALQNNLTGNFNSGLGEGSLQNSSTGNYNTAAGAGSGATLTTGGLNTFLGFTADALYPGITNSIAIGYGAKTATNNQTVIGNVSTTIATIYGQIMGNTWLTNASGSGILTLSNAPSAGTANASIWLVITNNGTRLAVPAIAF